MNIAFVEDDPLQRKPVCAWLEEAGYSCQSFENYQTFTANNPNPGTLDLLLLDWELPDRSGLDVLRWVRRELGQSLPVMFLTRRNAENDIVAALRSGADDYLVKPAGRNELLARIEALTRRNGKPGPDTGRQVIGPFEFDIYSRLLRRKGEPIKLTQKEFTLAHYLLSKHGQLVTREELLEKVWRQSTNLNTRTIDTHISRVRKKLKLHSEEGWQLVSIYQCGYRLDWLANETA
ncbi:MAG: response regulator transcription factor [Pseudomonadota bacterium]